MSGSMIKFDVVVADIIEVNSLVKRFEFTRVDNKKFPPFSGGSHVVVEMKDGDRTRLNPYSLMSDPNQLERYCVSIRRDDQGRGGSLFMHNHVKIGDQLTLSNPVNLFSLDLRARKHLMIAGGIGITPFMAQIKQLERGHENWELHYSCRSPELGSYASDLKASYPHNVHVYFDDAKEIIDLKNLLNGQPLGTHLYVCGPKGMINWVRDTAQTNGWPEASVHHEEFLAPQSGKPFQVQLAQSNLTIDVGAHESLLEAIERVGVDAPYLCRGGACGQCETNVLEYDGDFVHRDHWLDESDQKSCQKIMPCVSRFEGRKLVLAR